MLTVCPTPIGNLGDVTQRVARGASHGRRDRLRGHPADARAAVGARHPRAQARGLRRALRGAPRARPRGARPRTDARSSSSRMPACRASPIPVASSCARALAAGAPTSRCCRARERSRPRSSRAASPPTATSSAAGCRVPIAAAAALPRRRGERRTPGRRVRVAAARRVDARRARRGRARRALRALSRADEAVRGGACAARRPRCRTRVAGRELRGEVAIVISGSARTEAPGGRRVGARRGRRARRGRGRRAPGLVARRAPHGRSRGARCTTRRSPKRRLL